MQANDSIEPTFDADKEIFLQMMYVAFEVARLSRNPIFNRNSLTVDWLTHFYYYLI